MLFVPITTKTERYCYSSELRTCHKQVFTTGKFHHTPSEVSIMSKIYEALQQAHQQKKTSGKNLEAIIPQNLLNREEVEIGEEMLSLHKVIDTLLPGVKNRVIQFIGSRGRGGYVNYCKGIRKNCSRPDRPFSAVGRCGPIPVDPVTVLFRRKAI